ncbi:flippase [Vagococcus entomophilus]|uniref:Uncharacterized protein n=1 Tax=Vagococcus entomophilus TaxID=1160095 RepID=A0A430AIB6_9ENTE|nr:flippase [Vagococcus entomophilus]RSU07862.1 hypothetical protein CBF30_01075 [Vagococcus entomophilus]
MIKNFFYNLSYQVMLVLMPLLSVPYISRVLGVGGVGVYSYTFAIMQNFMLLANLGINSYGTRQIAYTKENLKEKSENFWSIVYLTLFSTLFSVVAMIAFANFALPRYKYYLYIQIVYLISSAFDISWFYIGIENFKKSVFKNSVVKILGFVSIFIFVKNKNDLGKYIWVLSLSQLIGQIILWVDIKKEIVFTKINKKMIATVFIGAMTMFIPQLAIKIYVVINKVILGFLTNTTEVGYFDSSDKVIKIITALISTIGLVMLPRISSLYTQNKLRLIDQYLNVTLDIATYMSIPIMVGIITCAPWFVPWFFGEGFNPVVLILQIIAPVILFIAWGTILGNQILLPMNQIKKYTMAVIAGAGLNLLSNFLFIPLFKANGAAVSTVLSEMIVASIMLYHAKNSIRKTELIKHVSLYGFMAFVMGAITIVVGFTLKVPSPKTTVVQATLGMSVYFFLSIIFKVPVINLIKEKVYKKK